MPSDLRVSAAREAFAPLFTAYRSAVAATLDEVRGCLMHHAADASTRTAQVRVELGPFAMGRIDAARLTSLLGETDRLAPGARARLDRAAVALADLAARGEDLMHLEVPRGTDLVAAVRNRLAQIGRAFGAARVAASRTSPGPMSADEESGLSALPFCDWSAAERRLGPPLVVSVNGSDLHPAGLAAFVDGLQKIVLIVNGDAPPAPLVRLVTPGVFVAQSLDPSICGEVARWPGPAVAAVMPASCAAFVHDPSAGPELWQRVKVHHLPAPSTVRIGALSSAQQMEEVRQLEALGQRPITGDVSARGGESAADPVDRVAAWLLRQAGLGQPAGGD